MTKRTVEVDRTKFLVEQVLHLTNVLAAVCDELHIEAAGPFDGVNVKFLSQPDLPEVVAREKRRK